MRMRKKKNLEQRIEACSELILTKFFEDGERIPFEIVKPAWLEIGCGKGAFVNQAARKHADVCFIAVEKNENVIISALERTKSEKHTNIRYIIGLAEYLERVLTPCSVERIYLNFSCPFPKNRYEKHRLTSRNFLEMYKRILTDNGALFFKTDNLPFYEYSTNNLKLNGFTIINKTDDLHNSDITGNIITEYEELFINKGIRINYLEANVKK